MRARDKLLTVALTGALLLSTAGMANAAPKPRPPATVVSAAGITAIQIAPAGATDSQVDAAIRAHQLQGNVSGGVTTLGTADYYSYCQEGSSGLMVWTNNDPKYCYGWYYRYLNGVRLDKINMIKLKAAAGPAGPDPAALKRWCDNNGFYCTVATIAAQALGSFLVGLLD